MGRLAGRRRGARAVVSVGDGGAALVNFIAAAVGMLLFQTNDPHYFGTLSAALMSVWQARARSLSLSLSLSLRARRSPSSQRSLSQPRDDPLPPRCCARAGRLAAHRKTVSRTVNNK